MITENPDLSTYLELFMPSCLFKNYFFLIAEVAMREKRERERQRERKKERQGEKE